MASTSKAAAKEKKPKAPPVKCNSLADVDALLAELADMSARQKSIECDLADRLRELTESAAAKLAVEIDGQQIPFADRAKSIEATLETWCAAHRRELLEGDAKSLQLNHGEVGWEKAHDKIDPTKSKEKKGNPDVLEAVTAHLRKSLEEFSDLSAALCDCLSIDPTWLKTALKKGIDEGKFTAEELRSIGFKKTTGDDEFFCRPAEVELKSLAAQ